MRNVAHLVSGLLVVSLASAWLGATPVSRQPEQFLMPPDAPKIGVGIARPDGFICVAIATPSLETGSAMTLVDPTEGQPVRRAVVDGRAESCDDLKRAEFPAPYYLVRLLDSTPVDRNGPLVAIAGAVDSHREGQGVGLRLGLTHPNAHARSCTSLEGVHLTVWSSVPQQSYRLWHAYYYLGLELEPSCSDADFGTAMSPSEFPQIGSMFEQLKRAEQRWAAAKIDAYEFNVRWTCGLCAPEPPGRPPVVVRGGQSTIKGGGPIPDYLARFGSIDRLFRVIRAALEKGAPRARVEYDAIYGYPKTVFIDPAINVTDNEIEFVVEGFEVAKQ